MKKKYLIFIFFLFSISALRAAEAPERLIVHLLDYVATDYENAVANGQIIDSFEYQEMLEFNQNISILCAEYQSKNSSDKALLIQLAFQLDSLVKSKQAAVEIAKVATAIKNHVIKISGMAVAPISWPNQKNGKRLYSINCESCHGNLGKGDGMAGIGLSPAPTNFSSQAVMGSKSPLQAFHTIRFGVEGTAMMPYLHLRDEEVWDLAFYIHTLRFENKEYAKPKTVFSLSQLSVNSDLDLEPLVREEDKSNTLAWWRFFEGDEGNSSLALAMQNVNQSLELYAEGKFKEARSFALSAYLEGIEPIELTLRAQDPDLVFKIEVAMGKLRSGIEKEVSLEELETVRSEIQVLIDAAMKILGERTSSFWLIFSLAASVILREGLEAFLIIIIMISVLRKAGAVQAVKWVHFGWLSAFTLGVLSWFFTSWLLAISGAQREVLEGVVALVAVIILLYMGFWMHSKSEAQKWSAFVKEKIDGLLKKESMIGMAFLSFLVVFREAFESVLFLSAISLEDDGAYNTALLLGVIVALVLVAFLATAMLKYSKKIPIPQLFKFSAIIVAILSIVLVGKGVHSLQEAGWLSITSLNFSFRMGLLGFYPTVQTVVAQLLLVLTTVLVWKFQNNTKVQKA